MLSLLRMNKCKFHCNLTKEGEEKIVAVSTVYSLFKLEAPNGVVIFFVNIFKKVEDLVVTQAGVAMRCILRRKSYPQQSLSVTHGASMIR